MISAKPALSAVVLALAVVIPIAAPAQELRPTGYVNDFANVLTPDTRTALESQLRTLEDETTIEVAVMTVPSLSGATIEEYANRLFLEWGVGQKGRDNGVLIVVAPTERRMRIEVGYGLEPILPDGLAGEVIREEFLPAFQSQDVTKGIVDGTRRVEQILRANQPAPAPVAALPRTIWSGDWIFVTVIGLILILAGHEAGVGIAAKALLPIVKGIVLAAVAVAITKLLVETYAMLLSAGTIQLPMTLAGCAWGFREGRKPHWRRGTRGKKGGSHWVWGTDAQSTRMRQSSSSRGSSGSSGSGGGGGGGFGGGRSGGGGASGRW